MITTTSNLATTTQAQQQTKSPCRISKELGRLGSMCVCLSFKTALGIGTMEALEKGEDTLRNNVQ